MGVLAGYAAWMATLIALHYALPGLGALTWALIGATAVVAMLAGAVLHRPATVAPWVLLALANACSAAGRVTHVLLAHAPLEEAPLPAAAAPLYLLQYPLYLAGLVLLIRLIGPVRDRRATIDALIMTIALGLLGWIFLIRPVTQPAAATHQALTLALAIAYPAGTVLILGALARLLTPGTARGRTIRLLTAGFVSAMVSDVAVGLLHIHGTFHGDTVFDLGWIACYALWGAAALDPRMASLGRPLPRHADRPGGAGRLSASNSTALLLTALTAPVVLFFQGLLDRSDTVEWVAASACALLFGLVFARLRDVNATLARGQERERALRLAGVSLARVSTVEDIGVTVREAVCDFMGPDSRFEALLAVREGAALRVVATARGEQAPRTSLAEMAPGWLPRLERLRSADPRFARATDLTPAERAAAEEAGYSGVLLCPLKLRDRPTGEPLLGLLAIVGQRPALDGMVSSFGILASQAALALERVMLSQQIAARRGEELFRTLVQDAFEVILVLDNDGTIRYATPSAATVYGENVSVDGANARELVAEAERVPRGRDLPPPADGDPHSGLYRIRRHDGRQIYVQVRYSDLRDDETVRGIVLTVRDVTAQRELEDRLTYRAFHDALTGLPNRLLFADRAAHAISLARRAGTIAAVLFIDLDDFKVVNDTMGHGVGDELLTAVARRLEAVVRAADTAARLGGDEFALLIEDLADASMVDSFANRVIEAFSEPFELSIGSLYTTVTAGVATTEDSGDVDQLLRHADLSVYAAKAEGKRRWHRYEPALSTGMVRRRELQAALERTIAKEAFEIAYQPIVDLATGAIRGFEALARWPDPGHGTVVSPSEFIELAEDTGLIVPLGSWVMRQAIGDLAGWRGSDPGPAQPAISVNVSARQFRDAGFVPFVRKCLDDSGLVPSALTIELTETALLRRDERTASDLAELKHIGVRLAVDDFGTGYSSLSYLGDLPIDALKIDKSFVDRVTDGEGRAFAELIVGFAHQLKMAVIAEGIETEQQRDILLELGCRYGQGFLLARPMGWDQALALLRAGQGLASRPR